MNLRTKRQCTVRICTIVCCAAMTWLVINMEVHNVTATPKMPVEHLRVESTIGDVLEHPAFAGFARLLLPDDRQYDAKMRLLRIGSLLPYHTCVDPTAIVSSLNLMIGDAAAGHKVFYDFYTDAAKEEDPSRWNTGLFFFRGKPGAPFAVIAPGGGFAYVGSVHEGFLRGGDQQALEIVQLVLATSS